MSKPVYRVRAVDKVYFFPAMRQNKADNGLFSSSGKLKSGLLSIILLSHAILPAPACAQGVTSAQGIAAIVNDDIISALDVNSRIKFTIFSSKLANNKQVVARIKPQILRKLIDEKLQAQEAKRANIKISDAELKNSIRLIEQRNKLQKGEMRKVFFSAGIDWRNFNQQIETDLAWRKVILRRVLSGSKIGDDAVDEQISLIEANKGKPEYLVGEIFLPFDSSKSVGDVQQLANRLHGQISKGADFPAVARSFSQSASAATGGGLGWIRTDQLDEQLAKVITKMTPGKLSPPLRGADGFYILVLRNKRIAQGLPPPDISVTLQQIFLPLRANASPGEISAQESLANSISSSASNCQDMDRIGKEKGAKQSGRLSNIKASALPENLRNAVLSNEVGKASKPIRTPAGYVVLMACSKSGDNSNQAVRQKIEQDLLEKKASLFARRLLRDLRRSAFVDIRR